MSAFGGRLYLFVDWFNACPWEWKWERAVDHTITTWNGASLSMQLFNDNCGSSRCKWTYNTESNYEKDEGQGYCSYDPRHDLTGTASQSSTGYGGSANKAVDGNSNQR